MKLSQEEKSTLLKAAKQVYSAYLALDFFKTYTFYVNEKQYSLFELCQKAIKEKKFGQELLVNNRHYRLIVKLQQEQTYSVDFFPIMPELSVNYETAIIQYSDAKKLSLLTIQQFIIENNDVSTKLGEYTLGGLGKIDLYRTHLVTLYHIIEKLESEEELSSILVALPARSGKTFVQALWMLVISLSDNNALFAVPGKLLNQFVKDLKRLLPEELVNNILLIQEKDSSAQAHSALNQLSHSRTKRKIVIGASEYLLDSRFNELEAIAPNTFLSFDEQHLIMKVERRRLRLVELAQQKLTLFLTATPNQETYELAGRNPVAIMSSRQKQEASQGSFPRLITLEARTVSDQNRLRNYYFWTKAFWQTIGNQLLLNLMDVLQKDEGAAAVSVIEDLMCYRYDKQGEEQVRWRLQVPAARKMLCIIDDNATLINFCYWLMYNKN